jgi:ankyrin repeat protein
MKKFALLLAFPLMAVDPFLLLREGDASTIDARAMKADGTTALMFAVLTADAAAVRNLLERDADVNAANRDGYTALHFAVYDEVKTALLLAKGANAQAATATGVTPLLVAAGRPGGAPIVKQLLEAGADPNAGNRGGLTPLDRAAQAGDVASLQALFAKGAQLAPSSTALYRAAKVSCLPCAELLLAKGAAVDGLGDRGETALHDAAIRHSVPLMQLLLKNGAVVDRKDKRGYTALARAAISFDRDPAAVALLLRAGAKVNAVEEDGLTPLTLTLRFEDGAMAKLLREAGGTGEKEHLPAASTAPAKSAEEALARAIPLLQKTGPAVWKQRGCTSCHSNHQPAGAIAAAKAHGIGFDVEAARRELRVLVAMENNRTPNLRIGFITPEITGYVLDSLAKQQYPANKLTDAEVQNLAFVQAPEGYLKATGYRVPQQYSSIGLTAYAIRAFTAYPIPGRAEEFADRVGRARRWLEKQKPVGVEEQALRLLGLRWGKAAPAVIRQAADDLRRAQRPDGGWAQMPYLTSDAYATGMALDALNETNPTAIAFLLRTQYPDGSWFVQTRAHPLQPKMDSGYPFGYNQWISAAGASWAVEALAKALPVATATARN